MKSILAEYLKTVVKRIPLVGPLALRTIGPLLRRASFPGSLDYWESRYTSGEKSGPGSYGTYIPHLFLAFPGFSQILRKRMDIGSLISGLILTHRGSR